MKTREELIKQQEKLLAVYEKVKDKLKGYPNVVNIGIGMKEKDGQLTEEGCIKIIVREKKKESDLDTSAIIPKEVEGIATDIIILKDKISLAVCTDDGSTSHRPLQGGGSVKNVRKGSGVGGGGTMGCLGQLDSDSSWVILSNHHVLYGDDGQDGDEIGQPWVGCCCCCKTNVIAKNHAKHKGLDCAIAKVEDDVGLENKILEIGNISGSGAVAAVNGERVRKRGARTGFTSGTISFIDPSTKEITIDPKAAGGPANDPGGCTNYESGVTVFAYHGDSGSVVVNDNYEVIALLYAVSADYTNGFAKDILQVQTMLSFKIKTTSSAAGRIALSDSATALRPETGELIFNGDLVEYLGQELDKTSTGQKIPQLVEKNQQEVLYLVNKHRPVTITWQRKQGPAFIAAFGRSVKHPGYIIPPIINRISLQNLLMSMASILEEHGSEALREDIQKYSLDIIALSRDCKTADDYMKAIAQIDEQNSFHTKLHTH
ncbi:MAG: hypothetical protein WAT92_12780 [Saprospiraceae bacterium]